MLVSQWKTWLSMQHETFIGYLLEGIADGENYGTTKHIVVFWRLLLRKYHWSSSTQRTRTATISTSGTVGMVSERLLNKLVEAVVKSRQCFIQC